MGYDTELVKRLRGILTDLRRGESELYATHPGCACNRSGLCAHHAAVSAELLQAIDHIDNAKRHTEQD